MKRILAFPPDTKIEWKSHDSSLQQRREIDEARKDKSNQHNHSSAAPRNGDHSLSSDKKQNS
jgi:translation initiation factor 4E